MRRLLPTFLLLASPTLAADMTPLAGDARSVLYGERTITAAVELDREGARLVGYTLKPRPLVLPAGSAAEPRHHASSELVQVEVSIVDATGARLIRRLDVAGLCLEHDPYALPHVEGDTIRLHRDSIVVDLPERAEFDRIEVAIFDGDPLAPERRVLASARLDAARFDPAAGPYTVDDLAFTAVGDADDGPTPMSSGEVHWPEEFGDGDVYRVWGDEAELDRRINVLIVPDGYVYAEKTLMETHAANMVAWFRGKTPYAEHDPFFNYILIYAYGNESGTDECDCNNVVDTAMATRFPDAGGSCGSSRNRCLFYGTGNGGPDCDPNVSTANISAAELRAPARNVTIIMVNTTRYGGCGGSRAVYAAGASSAEDIAVHELGHSLAGLSDEYAGNSSCGSRSGVNVSTDAVNGAWPEWITDLGAPREGARYYDQCIFRPQANCDMRSLNRPFCAVCNQHWAITIFDHWQVAPTAPITSAAPASPVAAAIGVPVDFTVATRLAIGSAVNAYSWMIQGPGFPTPTLVSSAGPSYQHTFADGGTYTVTFEVIADTNFIKPARYGANVESTTWTIDVQCGGPPLPVMGNVVRALRNGVGATISWADLPAAEGYELGRSISPDFSGWTSLGTALSGTPGLDDLEPMPAPGLRTYRVAETACGVAGPF